MLLFCFSGSRLMDSQSQGATQDTPAVVIENVQGGYKAHDELHQEDFPPNQHQKDPITYHSEKPDNSKTPQNAKTDDSNTPQTTPQNEKTNNSETLQNKVQDESKKPHNEETDNTETLQEDSKKPHNEKPDNTETLQDKVEDDSKTQDESNTNQTTGCEQEANSGQTIDCENEQTSEETKEKASTQTSSKTMEEPSKIGESHRLSAEELDNTYKRLGMFRYNKTNFFCVLSSPEH